MTCRTATWITLISGTFLAGVALWWSPLNQDEGWLLMAAQRVSEGRILYLDFAFTQPPVFPSVYRLASPFIDTLGLAGARLFTLGLSLLGILLLVQTVRKTAPVYARPLGVLILLLCLVLNPAYLQFSTTVKTYALAGLLLTGALAYRLLAEARPSFPLFLISGSLCALAAGTRISLLVFALPLVVDLIRQRRDLGLSAAAGFSLGMGATLLAVFGPFLALVPEGLYFGLWEYHVGRESDGGLLLRAAFVLRWLRSILPVAVAIAFLWTRRKKMTSVSTAILSGVLLVTLVHLTAPFPYEEYQTILLPALALVAALEIPRALPENLRRTAPGSLLAFCLLFAVTSPSFESWFAGTRDRLWWPVKRQSDLSGLREAARLIESRDPEGRLLLTPDIYLAIEAGRDVPSGLEMGPFAYFPNYSTDRAGRLQVLNTERLFAMIHETNATMAALSGYAFTIQSPMLTPTPPDVLRQIDDLIRERFVPAGEIDPFGQAGTTLRIWRSSSPWPSPSDSPGRRTAELLVH